MSAIPRLDLPSAMSASTWCSRGGERLQRVVLAAPAHHQRHDLGIERRPALGHPAHRVGERVDVGHPVLEQVADAPGVLADEVQRVGLVAKLGEHEDPDLRVACADLDGGAQAVVGVVGRHLHVHDRDVGPVGGHLAPQVVGVAGLGDDLEAGVGQQAAQPLAQEHLVLGHHDSQRRHGRTLPRGRSGRASRTSPVRHAATVGERAGSKRRVRARDAL